MITLTHTVASPTGMHARPAGQLAQIARKMTSSSLTFGETTVDLAKLFAVLGLNIGQGDTFTIAMDGPDEYVAESQVRAILAAEL